MMQDFCIKVSVNDVGISLGIQSFIPACEPVRRLLIARGVESEVDQDGDERLFTGSTSKVLGL